MLQALERFSRDQGVVWQSGWRQIGQKFFQRCVRYGHTRLPYAEDQDRE